MIVGTARQAADLLAPYFSAVDGEKLVILHLDGERRTVALDERRMEGRDELTLPLREIVARALELGTRSLVIAHNHPSGDPQPSRADIDATRRLAETAANLGIRLDDHLIFAGDGCSSLRALGFL